MSQDHDELLKRAVAAHLKKPGAMQPSARDSGVEEVNGLTYVALRSSSFTAAYRVRNDGALKALKRWPKELDR